VSTKIIKGQMKAMKSKATKSKVKAIREELDTLSQVFTVDRRVGDEEMKKLLFDPARH